MIRILHVDDSETDHELIRIQLARHDTNLEIEWAAYGEEAIHMLDQGEYDCILSDFQMPGLDGLELLKSIRGAGNTTPFIFLTGQGNEGIASEALRAGADDYYTKDVGLAHYQRLINSIRRVVEAHDRRVKEQLAKQALQESEEKYRNLVVRANDLIVIVQDGLLKYANPKTAELLGYSVDETIDSPYLNYIWPEERESIEKIYRQRIAGEDVPQIYESALQHRSGERIEVEINAGRIDYNGRAADLVFIRDITERKLTEKALRESEEKMRSVFRAAPTGIGIVVDRVFTEVNQKICDLTGYSKDELIGQSARMIYPSDEEFDFVGREKYRQIAERGTGAVETRFKRKDGTQIDVLMSSTPIDPEDLSQGVTFTALDITERKQAEEALAKSEKQYRTLVERANDLIFIIQDDILVFANPKITDLLGYEPEEVLNTPAQDFIHPDAADQVMNYYRKRLAGEDVPQIYEAASRHKDGSRIETEINAGLVEFQGRPADLVIIRDISERKKVEAALLESEERLALALEATSDALWDWKVNSGVTYYSPRYYTMLGYEPDDFPPVYDSWLSLLHQDDKENAITQLERLSQPGQDTFLDEFRMRSKSGRWQWILSRGKVVERDSNGKPLRIIGTHTDITIRKETEEALRKSEERLALALDAATDGLWDWNVPTGEAFFSPRYYTMFGYEHGEFPPNLQTWASLLHPDDRDGAEALVREITSEKSDSFETEFRMKAKSGEWRWILSRGKVAERDETGKPLRIVGTHVDVSMRKQAEEKLAESEARNRAILEASIDGILIAQIDSKRFTYANSRICEMLGYTREELLGMSVFDIHPENCIQNIIRTFEAQSRGEFDVAENLPCKRKDGTILYVNIAANTARIGGRTYQVGFFRDITESRSMAVALEKERETLRKIVDLNPYAIGLYDADGRFVRANQAFVDLFKSTPPPDYSLFEDLILLKHGYADDLRCLRGGEVIQIRQLEHNPHTIYPDLTDNPVLIRGIAFPITGAHGKPENYAVIVEDLTSRARAEEKLLRKEDQLRAVVNTLPDLLFILNEDGKFLDSLAGDDSLLYAGDVNFVGKRIVNVMPPEIVDPAMDTIRLTVETGESQTMQYSLDMPSGQRHWFEGRTALLDITADGKKLILWLARDITEEKESEDRLRELERERTVILDNMIEHVVLHDTEMRVVWANKTACESVESPLESIVGCHCYEIWRTQSVACPNCPVRSALDTGEVHSEEIQVLGGGIWLIQGSPVKDESGKVIGAVETSIEITERRSAEQAMRRSEARLRSIFETADSVSFVLTDLNHMEPRIIEYSPGSENIFGYSREEALGMPVYLLHPPEDTEKVRQMVADIRDKKTGFQGEITCVRKDGTTFPGVLHTQAITDDEGHVLAALGVSYDISARKQAEENIKHYAEQLELRTQELISANKELEAFSYSVSHDLRAPLRHIEGFSELLLQDHSENIDTEGREYLERVGASARDMSELIDGMLKLSRLSRTELTRERVNLSQLAASIAEKLQKSHPDRKVSFKIAEGAVSRGDLHLIHSILENLLGNAFKFTSGKKNARIEFGAEKQDGRIVFFVRDNGAGFNPADSEKLFIPFARLHSQAEFEGTGIGLATVQRIVRRHGGDVWAEGKPGKGATFYFTLA